MKNVLILCTGNSCRSIMAEALINAGLGSFDIKAYSSGVSPSGSVNPNALKALQENGIDTAGLKSKNISELDGTVFDLVVTVCDNAKESCPIFGGNTKTIHCGFEDPSGKEYDEYVKTLGEIKNILLPIVKLELFGKSVKDVAKAIQTDDGVEIQMQGVNEDVVRTMVQNCSEGKCDCMDKETKAKITAMEFAKQGDTSVIKIKGFVTKEDIEKAMSQSSVKCC